MVVRGLTSLIEKFPKAWSTYTLNPTSSPTARLIVDGDALAFSLYFEGGFNIVCGGQYAEYMLACRKFLTAFKRAGFSLMVLFSGVASDLVHAKQRLGEDIKAMRQLVRRRGRHSGKMLPLFAQDVLLQVLRELSIPVKMCDGDSTPVILGMARAMKCGVLSRDSAYFLHEVPQGYVPIHRVQIKGGSLTMQVYNCGSLASVIFGMKPQLLPLWSSLAGAPLGHETGIRLFQRHIKDKFKYDAEDPRSSHAVFHGISQWLNQFSSAEEAFPHVQAIVLQEQEAASARASRGEVDVAAEGEADASASAEDKTVNVAALVAALKDAVSAVGATAAAPEAASCSLKDFLGRPVPQWLVPGLRGMFIDPSVLSILVKKTFLCKQGVSENVEQASAWDASKKLRQNLYAILLGASQSVEEHVRQASAVATVSVPACDLDASGNKVPTLAAIESSSPAERASWMTSLCAASSAKDALQQLPAGLVLPAIALRFMVATSDSAVPSWFIAGLSMALLRPFNEEKVKRTEESVFGDVGIAHAYSNFLCTLYSASLCNSLFKNALPPSNLALLDSAYALKLINEVSPHINAPLARVARNRGVSEDAYAQLIAAVTNGLQDKVDGSLILDAEFVAGQQQQQQQGASEGPVVKSAFAALLHDAEEEEEEEEDSRDTPSPVVVSAAQSPIALPNTPKGKALEKQTRQKEADDELALLAAMIEGVPDQGQAFEPAKPAAKETKTKKQPAFPTASLPKPVKSSAKGKGGGGGDGGKEGGKGRKMYFD